MDFALLNLSVVVNGQSIHEGVAVVPEIHREVPEGLNEFWKSYLGMIFSWEIANSALIVMSTEPFGGNSASEKVSPADKTLINKG